MDRQVEANKRYRARQRRKGLCVYCPQPRSEYSVAYCEFHRGVTQERLRLYGGWQPWVKGGRGRPPKNAEES